MGQLNVKLLYPYSNDYYYETVLERIDLDKEREKDLLTNNGFIVSEPQNIKKDVKNENSIFSTKFGQGLRDMDPFANRYSCPCGETTHRVYLDTTCKYCGQKVKFVDDNFKYFGWIISAIPIIHPNIYKTISHIIGEQVLDNILKPVDKKNKDGYSIEYEMPKDEPYFGVGMIYFKEHFWEIIEYYTNNNKLEYYLDLKTTKHCIFTHSIPVYTTQLRPFDINGSTLSYEGTNGLYNMMAKFAHQINNNSLQIYRKKKTKNQLLYDLQVKYNKLYKEIIDILSTKKGQFRSLFGGRYNFSSRCVIVSDVSLKMNEVKLPYECLIELLQQQIINIIQTTYQCSYSEAYDIWYFATLRENEMVKEIILSLINSGNIHVIINRNPSIQYGSILCMKVVGLSSGYTMAIPLEVIKDLAADFDGDCLNILYIINRDFLERALEIFDPRNAMCISRNDGNFNPSVNHQRDLVININTFTRLGRKYHTEEELNNLRTIMANNKRKRMNR